MDTTGRSNGLYVDKNGNILACADEKNELWSFSPEKRVTVLLKNHEGHSFNGPNDLWVDRQGGIYFTDPYYQRDYWERKKPDLEKQNVYYLPKNGKGAIIVDDDLMQPNGIVGSPNSKKLFVADIRANKTYVYQIKKDGSLSNRTLFAAQGSDGMTLDKKGNLYLTGRGVSIYNPEGEKIGTIPLPSRWTANLCFGGKKRSTLFMTASEYVYTLEMEVKGVE
ncbi:MAG: SMP-30/gluconolactonase/LRE family protein [Saprospiraceae bacterium]|nr:SMP-30/gluconolactonase/LRE family protein [Saprospiraceae bacterium]